MVWINQSGDTVYCASSSGAGLFWGSPIVVAATTPFVFELAGVRTNTGRVIVVWGSGEGPVASFSDNNGVSWTTPIPATFNGEDFAPVVTQTVDGKLWLIYNRFNPGTSVDIYYRTSTDNGSSWSAEQTFLATPDVELGGTIVSGSGSTLLAVYAGFFGGNRDPDIYRRTSSDGGNTWSEPSPILNSREQEDIPRVLRQSDGTLWMTYEVFDLSALPYAQVDIYYLKSTDGGNSWSAPVKFTRYAHFDAGHNSALVNDQPFVSFWSDRWAAMPFQGQIWYGLIGTTTDDNPPPAFFDAYALATQPNFAVVRAFVADETGIADVKISYTHNESSHGPLPMYDDGQHNDRNPSDNFWGLILGPVQLGDLIFPTFSITDNSSNTVEISSFPAKVKPVHNAGNVILSFDDNSQLGEFLQATSTSVHWPAENGLDYIFLGGLWVGANVAGESRVSTRDFFEIDWNRTPGTPYTLAPGVSDQDGEVTYDDQSTSFSAPVGVQVHQQSYQWSAPTRDDFIVFKYTIRNTGLNGDLSDVFVSSWIDPDMPLWTLPEASDDRPGYDSQRRMIYMYDNDPPSYMGLKLLGANNTPHTAHVYPVEEELFEDAMRYQYMSNGSITIPTAPGDYRMLLTAQPFSLAVGDSATVAYGLVMGANLSELQTHADTLEAIYGSIRTEVAEFRSDQIPTSYSLAQNYPNPFNPGTAIWYALPKPGHVTLKVYNLAGQEVRSLVNEARQRGSYQISWNGRDGQGRLVPSGIYFYRLQAGSFVETRKMVLAR